MLMPPWVVWTTRTLRGQNLAVNLAVGGYAGCVLLWKLGSGENVCTVGRRVERNGLAALGGCHNRINTVLREIMVVKAMSSQLIEVFYVLRYLVFSLLWLVRWLAGRNGSFNVRRNFVSTVVNWRLAPRCRSSGGKCLIAFIWITCRYPIIPQPCSSAQACLIMSYIGHVMHGPCNL